MARVEAAALEVRLDAPTLSRCKVRNARRGRIACREGVRRACERHAESEPRELRRARRARQRWPRRSGCGRIAVRRPVLHALHRAVEVAVGKIQTGSAGRDVEMKWARLGGEKRT